MGILLYTYRVRGVSADVSRRGRFGEASAVTPPSPRSTCSDKGQQYKQLLTRAGCGCAHIGHRSANILHVIAALLHHDRREPRAAQGDAHQQEVVQLQLQTCGSMRRQSHARSSERSKTTGSQTTGNTSSRRPQLSPAPGTAEGSPSSVSTPKETTSASAPKSCTALITRSSYRHGAGWHQYRARHR